MVLAVVGKINADMQFDLKKKEIPIYRTFLKVQFKLELRWNIVSLYILRTNTQTSGVK